MATYAELESAKKTIIDQLAAEQNNLAVAKAKFGQISNSLATMQTTYGTWAGEVNALAVAEPANAAVLALKAARDKLVAEFASAKAEADSLDTTING